MREVEKEEEGSVCWRRPGGSKLAIGPEEEVGSGIKRRARGDELTR